MGEGQRRGLEPELRRPIGQHPIWISVKSSASRLGQNVLGSFSCCHAATSLSPSPWTNTMSSLRSDRTASGTGVKAMASGITLPKVLAPWPDHTSFLTRTRRKAACLDTPRTNCWRRRSSRGGSFSESPRQRRRRALGPRSCGDGFADAPPTSGSPHAKSVGRTRPRARRRRLAGKTEASTMRHGRWRNVQVARRYIRAGQRWDRQRRGLVCPFCRPSNSR
jgi:hypothetical protein